MSLIRCQFIYLYTVYVDKVDTITRAGRKCKNQDAKISEKGQLHTFLVRVPPNQFEDSRPECLQKSLKGAI